MKPAVKRIVVIGGISTGIFAAVLAGLVFFSTTEEPSGNMESFAFSEVKESGPDLPELSFYKGADGERLAYRSYQSEESERIVIMLHGSGYHSRYLHPLAEGLAAREAATVVTPDLRGHGPTAERRGDVDYVGQIEDDLEQLIDHVREAYPEASLYLGGHSSGGGSVIRFAGGAAEADVDGYILLAPYIHHNSEVNQNTDEGWSNPNIPRMAALSIFNSLGATFFNGKDVISFNMPENYRDGTETLYYSYRLQTSMHPRDDYDKDIQGLEADTLVIAGEKDRSFHVEAYPSLFERQKHAEVVLKEDLSHFGVVTEAGSHEAIASWLENRP